MPAHLHPVGTALATLVLLVSLARAQDGANLVPAQTATFIQVNDLSTLRKELGQDPLVRAVLDPTRQPPALEQVWQQIEQAMGLPRGQVFDRYFGRKIVCAAPADRHEGVLISAVPVEDAQLAVKNLALAQVSQAGPMTVYRTGDGQARVAFGNGWMVLGSAENGYYDEVVKTTAGTGATLSQDPAFRTWSGRLPADGSAFFFHRDAAQDEFHTLSLRRDGRSLVLDYAGDFRPARAVMALTSNAQPLDFGPLPASTIAALTLNLFSDRLHPRLTERIDSLIAPRSFSRDILPKLAAPWVVGLAEVPNPDPADPRLLPAIALAVKMRDPAVIADLDALAASLVSSANLAAVASGTEGLTIKTIGDGPAAYHLIDVSGPVARRINRPDLANLLHIAYGRIGDWYVVCTQESLFQQCRAAEAGPESAQIRVLSAESFRDLPLTRPSQPVLTALIRGPRLAYHLDTLTQGRTPSRSGPGASFPIQALATAARLLSNSPAAAIQAWQESPDTLRATVRIQR